MHDKDLHYKDGYQVADVLYSTDNAHRFVILKSDADYLTYLFESLQTYDEEELQYFPDDTVAYWLPEERGAKPVFNDIDILMRELRATPEYKTFFADV